jgi:GT2 family glycosyltransferase
MKLAALIVGIDGWELYTLPLIQSLQQYEPEVQIIVVDNASQTPYPETEEVTLVRTERLCYAAAINRAAQEAQDADWLMILSNDVIVEGPFAQRVASLSKCVAGPQDYWIGDWRFIVGWCVCVPRRVFDALQGWDEQFVVSSWEDVDFSFRAQKMGLPLAVIDIPLRHLAARQRFSLPEFDGTHERNRVYFERKHGFR